MNGSLLRASSMALFLPLAGCVQPDPVPLFAPAWEHVDFTEEGWISSRSALVVADCQLHNLYSLPIPDRNLSIEGAVGTDIRPPQLDLFAEDVLAWILQNGSPDANVVLHLGDGLDLACEGELEKFLAVMGKAGRPWFMAPGNHDFYYFGSYAPDDEQLWKDACYESGEPLFKDRFLRIYVSALLAQDDPGCIALAQALGLGEQRTRPPLDLAASIPLSFEWTASDGAEGYLKQIAWKIDVQAPWRSFILQSIDLSPPDFPAVTLRAILMDSCQYAERPLLIPNAWQSYPAGLNCGSTGEMLPDQLRLLRSWIDSGARSNPAGFVPVMLCHHPFDELAPRTKSSLGWLWDTYSVGVMVSGHTHKGYFAYHKIGEEADELEINLGSTTDWPMEWRTLSGSFWPDPENPRRYIRAERQTLVSALDQLEGYFQHGWEVQPNAPDDYRKYRKGESAISLLVDFYLAHHLVPYWLPQPRIRANAAARQTEVSVKDTLLGTYERLILEFPTNSKAEAPPWPRHCRNDVDVIFRIREISQSSQPIEEKIALLEELEEFERHRSTVDRETKEPNDDVRLRFKLSQAAWASRYEAQHGRFLRVEDELIRRDALQAKEKRARLQKFLEQEDVPSPRHGSPQER